MQYEVTYRNKNTQALATQHVYGRNAMDAQVKFWTHVLQVAAHLYNIIIIERVEQINE